MLSQARVSAVLPFRGLSAAEDFYVRKLGLRREAGSVEDGYLEFAAGDGTVLTVFESDSPKSGDTAAGFDVPDLDREMAELRAKDVRFEDYDLPNLKTVNGVATHEMGRDAWIQDPSGNVLCLHQRNDRSARGR
jgi:catechol 2,3-dioxygenase-like lactoylglutathione lyase family enzyme